MRKLRFTLAGLMVFVLVAAVGLAALRNASPAWSGSIYLLSRAVLGLGIILAIYRRGADRAWWLGFCLFGWGYLALAEPRAEVRAPYMPTSMLLLAARPYLGQPAASGLTTMTAAIPQNAVSSLATMDTVMNKYHYLKIGHGLWAMVAALLGGLLARIICAWSADRSWPRETEAPPTNLPSRKRWLRPAIVAWTGLVLAAAAVAIRAGQDAGFWAGVTFLLTCGLLGLAGLGAIVGRGRRRQSWLGACLLGAGYMLLIFTHTPFLPLPSGQFLNALREWIPDIEGGSRASDARIAHALGKPVPMSFPDPTPLSEVLDHVKQATATPTYPGITIYLDPVGLQEAEQSPSATVSIDLRGIPLKTTLRLCLKQLGLAYIVKDGVLRVTSEDDMERPLEEPLLWYAAQYCQSPATLELVPDAEDPFLIVGHCLIALLAAGFGAVATPLIADACTRSASTPERA